MEPEEESVPQAAWDAIFSDTCSGASATGVHATARAHDAGALEPEQRAEGPFSERPGNQKGRRSLLRSLQRRAPRSPAASDTVQAGHLRGVLRGRICVLAPLERSAEPARSDVGAPQAPGLRMVQGAVVAASGAPCGP